MNYVNLADVQVIAAVLLCLGLLEAHNIWFQSFNHWDKQILTVNGSNAIHIP